MSRTKMFLNVLLILLIAGVLSNFASQFPDGLERVAIDLDFINNSQNHASVFSDYSIPGVTNSIISGSIAGVLGCFLIFNFVYILSKLINLPKENS